MPASFAFALLSLAATGNPAEVGPAPAPQPCQPRNFYEIGNCWYVPDVVPEPGTIVSLTQLPASLRKAFERECGRFAVADVGAIWNATDVVRHGLPRRRLVSVTRQGGEWVIEYERGGFVKLLYLAVFRLQPEARLVRGNCGEDTSWPDPDTQPD